MKTKYLIIFITIVTNSYSQNVIENKAVEIDVLTNNQTSNIISKEHINKTANFLYNKLFFDPNTVFWTVNYDGEIQQWDLIDNQVTGGAVIQISCDLSLAFCGENGSLTFYSGKFPDAGIFKYDDISGCINIPTSVPLLNNGGYMEDQYFYSSNVGVQQELYYYNGTNLILLDQLPIDYFYMVADIAVDSLGRAWVFTGTGNSSVDTLRVYDKNGLETSYPFVFNSWNCYGSFFIEDKLYIGIGSGNPDYPNTILPIEVNESVVSMGTPIPFSTSNFLTDMASANGSFNLSSQDNSINDGLAIYPNPTESVLHLNSKENILSVTIYTMEGKLAKSYRNEKKIDVSDLEKSMYFLKIKTDTNTFNKIIVKK